MFGSPKVFEENRRLYRMRQRNGVNPDPDWGDLGWFTRLDMVFVCGHRGASREWLLHNLYPLEWEECYVY